MEHAFIIIFRDNKTSAVENLAIYFFEENRFMKWFHEASYGFVKERLQQLKINK